MSLENFKSFVRETPSLSSFVDNKEKTWQEFYNMFELYGPSSSVWDKYTGNTSSSGLGNTSLKDFFGMFRNLDMNEVQKGIGSLQKGIGYLQGMVKDKTVTNTRTSSYEPRPMYRQFDD